MIDDKSVHRIKASERLEQRHSLAEIVVALRVPPEDLRDLYHTWLVGLWAGELQGSEPALPMRHTEQDVVRRVTRDQLAQLLGALPDRKPDADYPDRPTGPHVEMMSTPSDTEPHGAESSSTMKASVSPCPGFISGPFASSISPENVPT
ncbi:MAG TPA: hypothetical protein VGL61_05395 [Kofleriaceae bacterium]